MSKRPQPDYGTFHSKLSTPTTSDINHYPFYSDSQGSVSWSQFPASQGFHPVYFGPLCLNCSILHRQQAITPQDKPDHVPDLHSTFTRTHRQYGGCHTSLPASSEASITLPCIQSPKFTLVLDFLTRPHIRPAVQPVSYEAYRDPF